MRRIITVITTIGALAFCIISGAAGYKQVYLATRSQETLASKASESVIKRTPNVVIYNISADKAVFYEEPKPEEIIPEDDDFYLLAASVEAEAGNQSLLGKRLGPTSSSTGWTARSSRIPSTALSLSPVNLRPIGTEQ